MQYLGKQIAVDSFVRYKTYIEKNSADWAAYKIRCILKGETFPYPFDMVCGGVWKTISNNNIIQCEEELARQCAARILLQLPRQQCTIVPVPNSSATAQNPYFKTLDHARMIASFGRGLSIAKPMLVWNAPQQKTHLGARSRLYREHLERLVVNKSTHRPIVLYDDVVTTGSQLVASKMKLEIAGFRVVGMIAVISVDRGDLDHSEVGTWKTETRTCF